MREKTITLCFMIDGLRYDYVERNKPSFLIDLSKKGYAKKISEPLMFQTRPAYFAGLYPIQSKIANLFWYEPTYSPFKFLKILPLHLLNKICSKIHLFNFLFRYFINIIGKKIEKIKSNNASCYYLNTYSIPMEFLPYFAYSEKKLIFKEKAYNFKTLFDFLRENEMEWNWIAYPTQKDLTVNGLKKAFVNNSKKNSIKFLFMHFGELDWIGHDHGPDSSLIGKKLKEIDTCIQFIYNYYESNGFNVKIIVFGDHGMVPVEKEINIIKYLQHKGIKISRNDIYFIDSNMFRFWSISERKKRRVSILLNKATFGTLLTREKQKELLYYNENNEYGDIIFLTHPGIIFFPSFFEQKKK